MDGRIFYLRKIILENIRHDWTVEQLAAQIDVSASYLQKLFKTETGMPPMSYVHNLRLEKARELLETGDWFYRISEVGYQVGLPDGSHFARDFKKKFGKTPTEYRKQFWEKIQADNQTGEK
jgi:AraC family L-rhamnose operon transcriptional activator RhaR